MHVATLIRNVLIIKLVKIYFLLVWCGNDDQIAWLHNELLRVDFFELVIFGLVFFLRNFKSEILKRYII